LRKEGSKRRRKNREAYDPTGEEKHTGREDRDPEVLSPLRNGVLAPTKVLADQEKKKVGKKRTPKGKAKRAKEFDKSEEPRTKYKPSCKTRKSSGRSTNYSRFRGEPHLKKKKKTLGGT